MSQQLPKLPLTAGLTPLTCLEVLPNLTPAQVSREFQNLKLTDNNFTTEYKRKILLKHFDLRITSEFSGSTFSSIWNLLHRNQDSLASLEGQMRDVNNSIQNLRGQVKKANIINSAVAPAEEITRNVVPAETPIPHLSSDDDMFKMVPQLTREDTEEGFPPVFLDSSEFKCKRQKSTERNVHLWQTSNKKVLRESNGERRRITRQGTGDKRKILTRQSTAESGSTPGTKDNPHKPAVGRQGSRWSFFNFFRGSSEYSDQSYNEYQIGEASPDTSPMHYRPRSLTPPPDHRRDYVPQPQPLSYIELNRLPVVKLQGHEMHIKCCCDKPWQKDEEATQLLCGHKLHSTCACKLMETGVCPICKTAEVIDDKDREIRIDLSGFNF